LIDTRIQGVDEGSILNIVSLRKKWVCEKIYFWYADKSIERTLSTSTFDVILIFSVLDV
jgi:hypothetical protein